jgi:hypothetical protein
MRWTVIFFVLNFKNKWNSMVPTLHPSEFCSNLVQKGGPLDKPKFHTYGRIEKEQFMSDKDEITVVDSEYSNWLFTKYGIKPWYSYGIVSPTEPAMIHQFVKFADDTSINIDWEVMNLSNRCMYQVLSPLIGNCRFTSFEDVEMNMDASNGMPLQTLYDKKGDAIANAHAEINWWLTDGWREAPPQYVKVTGKVERLPLEDIQNLKCRMFQPDPTQVLALEAQLNQDIIAQFKELSGTFSAYGFNKWEGGWDKFFKNYDHFKYFFAGDVERWDKHYQPIHHDMNTALKKEFIKPEHRKQFETDAKFDFINNHAKRLHCLLWTGDIVELEQGQGSGRYTTTFDNILTHMRILFYHYFRVRKQYKLELPTNAWEIKEFYDAFCFGDDSGGATDIEQLASFEERQRSYNDCGFRLKKEDDFFSETLIDLPFLGAKVGKYHSHYVFVMNPERVHGSLTALAKRMSALERFERTMQIFMNCVFTETPYPNTSVPTWQVLYERVKYLRSGLPDAELGAYGTIMAPNVYRHYALGLESANGRLKQLDPTGSFSSWRTCKIGEYLPGQSRDIKSGELREPPTCPSLTSNNSINKMA